MKELSSAESFSEANSLQTHICVTLGRNVERFNLATTSPVLTRPHFASMISYVFSLKQAILKVVRARVINCAYLIIKYMKKFIFLLLPIKPLLGAGVFTNNDGPFGPLVLQDVS